MSKLLLSIAATGLMFMGAANSQDAATPVKKPVAQSPTKSPVKAAAKAPATAPAKVARSTVKADRLDLETTVVTGNRELPKVLYIVPWKKADLGELPAQPFNTLLDEVLQPVDRDVFKREVKYFQAVESGVGSGAAAHQSGTAPPPVGSP